jgi:hypothetical protein
MKFCPDCKREITYNEIKCPFCGSETNGTGTLLPDSVPVGNGEPPPSTLPLDIPGVKQ